MNKRPLMLCTLLLAPAATASAAQSGSATRFNGTYTLACETAQLTLHVDAAGVIAGAPSELHAQLPITVDCNGVSDAELAAFELDVTSRCENAGFPADRCAELAADLSDSVEDLFARLDTIFPKQMTMNVRGTSDWLNQLLGVFPVRAEHRFADGTTSALDYLINNNDGSPLGNFGAVGIALPNAGTIGQLGCVDSIIGGVVGDIALGAPRTIAVDFAVDRSLTCAVIDGPSWILINAGIAFSASLGGESAALLPRRVQKTISRSHGAALRSSEETALRRVQM